MAKKGAKIWLFLVACAVIQKVGAQSLDSLPYTLTVESDILGMDLKSEEDSSRSAYIIFKGNGIMDQAALSSTLITQEEIAMSGATMLLEVLRLSPELIVRQSTNGNYTLHLRGSSSTNESLNNRNSVLLMIDEIPFYNFREQAVWWEALPVALQDIEQIEIVRTSHSAWYGPEAMDGVINIVTKADNSVGLRTRVNSQAGLRGNYSHQGSISINQGGRFRTRIAAFYNKRTRFQDAYYIFNPQRYVSSDSLLFYQVNAKTTNPSVRNALNNSGIHLSADYQWNANTYLQFNAGTQTSEAQGVFQKIEQIALTSRMASTNWFTLQSGWRSFTTYASYQAGTRMYQGYDAYQWDDMQQLVGRIEYSQQWKKYRLGLGTEALRYEYRDSEMDTTLDNPAISMFLPAAEHRYTASMFQELSLFNDHLTVALANRGDYYWQAEKLLLNHQLSASYQVHTFHKLSGTISQGNRPLNVTLSDTRAVPLSTRAIAYEAKYHSQITKNIRSELTFFHIQPAEKADSSLWSNLSQYRRSGLTAKLDWQINRLYLSGFVTGLRYQAHEEFIIPYTLPHFSGGVSGRYTALFGKLQAHASVYYYSYHEFSGDEQLYEIPAKLTLQGKLSYRIWEEHSVFFSSQNLLDSRLTEYPFGDRTRGMYWVGVNLRF